MFNFLKKRKEKEYLVSNSELLFFKSLISILPKKYQYLKPQINDDFLISFQKNELGFINSYTFSLNAKLESTYINKNLADFFIIQNIRVWNIIKNDFISINLNILSGYLGGFNIESIDFSKYDFSKFDISEINEKHFENKDLEKLLKTFHDDEKALIKENIGSTYEINLNEGKFYFFDDLSDGDVVALDINGNVFTLLHDPYVVKKIFTKEELINKLRTNTLKKDILKLISL